LRVLRDVGGEVPHKFSFAERKTHGYATYSDHEVAVSALKKIQRPPVGVHHPPFTAYLAPPKFYDSKSAPSMKVLFVRGTAGLSHETLRGLFGGSDIVEKVIIPVDSSKRTPLGHAFVHYFSSKHAAAAMSKLNNSEYEGHKLNIEWSLPRPANKQDSSSLSQMEYPYSYSYSYTNPYPYYQEFYPPYPYFPYDSYHTDSGGTHEYYSARVSRDKRSHRDAHSVHSYPYFGYGNSSSEKSAHGQKSNRFLPY